MPDIATISTFLKSIKTASDLAKTIKNVDYSIEKAELKLKIADLMESLAEVRIQALDVQEVIRIKNEKIKQLENQLEEKDKPVTISLQKESEAILQFLNKVSENFPDGVTAVFISSQLNLDEPKVLYFLDILAEKNFIDFSDFIDEPTYHSITKEGRKYIFEQLNQS